ncbi:MAG: peptidylprolyl isomerase [Acidobacteriota bacterium]
MKLQLAVIALVVTTLPLAAQKPKPASPPAPNAMADKSAVPASEVAATVNGDVITMKQLDDLYSHLSPQMRLNYDRVGGKKAFLSTYIEQRLIVQQAIKEGVNRNPDVKAEMQDAADRALYNAYVRDAVGAQIVTEADIRAEYEKNQEAYRLPERIRARHIIVTPDANPVTNSSGDNATTDEKALEKITAMAQRLRQGYDFGELAKQFSEDSLAPNGGELGWFGRGSMVPEFEEVAFTLQKGQISRVVKTQFGYHLIQLEDREDSKVAPFEEVRTEIRDRLLAEKTDKVMLEVNKLIRDLRQQSAIQVNAARFPEKP